MCCALTRLQRSVRQACRAIAYVLHDGSLWRREDAARLLSLRIDRPHRRTRISYKL